MSRERLIKILNAPHVSDKAAVATEMANQYVFKVVKDATKPEIRDAVELMFDVTVKGVQVVNLPAKKKRFGRIEGRRQGIKKAYVTLEEGQSIDFFGAE